MFSDYQESDARKNFYLFSNGKVSSKRRAFNSKLIEEFESVVRETFVSDYRDEL